MSRLHIEEKVLVSSDLAGEDIEILVDFEQDDDNIDYFKRVTVNLPASQAATEIDLPIGATKLKFLAVNAVSTSSGVNVYLSGSGNDPILVKPNTGLYGTLILNTEQTSVHVGNPSSTASVVCTITMGCTIS